MFPDYESEAVLLVSTFLQNTVRRFKSQASVVMLLVLYSYMTVISSIGRDQSLKDSILILVTISSSEDLPYPDYTEHSCLLFLMLLEIHCNTQ